MKLTWKQVSFFGFFFGIPFVVSIAAIARRERNAELLRNKRQELSKCARCVELVSIKAGLSFITHLIDIHRFSDEEAYETTNNIWNAIFEALRARGK